jgi:hypothetical protein
MLFVFLKYIKTKLSGSLALLLYLVYNICHTFISDFGTDVHISTVAYYSIIFLYALVIGLGVAGNLMILWAILSKSAMRTARNYFIVR